MLFNFGWFKGIVGRYKKICCNLNIMLQTVCMAADPNVVDNFDFVLNCRTDHGLRLNDGPFQSVSEG